MHSTKSTCHHDNLYIYVYTVFGLISVFTVVPMETTRHSMDLDESLRMRISPVMAKFISMKMKTTPVVGEASICCGSPFTK